MQKLMQVEVVSSDFYSRKTILTKYSQYEISDQSIANIPYQLLFLCYIAQPEFNVISNDSQHLMLDFFHWSYSQHLMLTYIYVHNIYVITTGYILQIIYISQFREKSNIICQIILISKTFPNEPIAQIGVIVYFS